MWSISSSLLATCRYRDIGAVPASAATRPMETADRKSTRLNSSHDDISYAVFCLQTYLRQRLPYAGPAARHQQHQKQPPQPAEDIAGHSSQLSSGGRDSHNGSGQFFFN